MVIFSIIEGELSVLLLNRDEHPSKGSLALPGGFIDLKQDQNIDGTAYRKLYKKTGVKSPYLEQVETIGNKTRDIRGWSVTVLYYALIDINNIKQKQNDNSQWMPVERALKTPLAFDHKTLIEKAQNRLVEKTRYTALPVELMPELFTLTELQTVFEIILGKKLPTKSLH
ncbi:MAG: NUDIX domain-containing protein [Proteobacteria bacterium]|nr:NUDIX domain-containing protein [Pseudomonadota bacterium]